jgi:hypothetical protein
MSFPSSSRAAAGFLRGDLSRQVFATLLRLAFPGDSDTERAETGGPVLGISPRHFRRLLQCEHDAKAPQVFAVVVLVGVETFLSIIYGGH